MDDHAGNDLRSYPGLRKLAGQTSRVMPYVDWVGYVAKCNEVVNNAYKGFALR